MLRVALSAIVVVGVKITPTVQVAPLASAAPQLEFPCVKSDAFTPVKEKPERVMVFFVRFAMVTVCAVLAVRMIWLPKLRELGAVNTPVAAAGDSFNTKPEAALRGGANAPG